jgi:NADH-quinone oxidoreductase subunit F
MVFDDTADIADALHRMAAFFRDESCGQCVPCRVGTVRQQELLPALVSAPTDTSSALSAAFSELSAAMRDASICGLGQTASAAIESALTLGLITRGE